MTEQSARKVLVVDDSAAILSYVQEVLSCAGYQVSTSSNPIAVAGLVRQETPDMILMDVHMPAISGSDVVATLRRCGCSEGVRVVLFSASLSESDLARRTAEVGAHGYIHKSSPIDASLLVRAVREHFLRPIQLERPRRALVVDDSRAMRLFLSRTLRKEGYEVTSAADGEEALEALGEQQLDLALVDLEMPRMGGLELVRAIRAHRKHAQVPVLLVTSVRDPQRVREVLEAGARACLHKPLESDEVLRHLRALGA